VAALIGVAISLVALAILGYLLRRPKPSIG